MKKVIRILGIFFLVIIFFASISKFREQLCQIPNLPLRTGIEYFFTPKDLYEGVFHEIIDVSKSGYTKDINFKFKYVGCYEVTLELYKFDWDELVWEESKRKLNLKLKLDFYKEKELIYSTITSTDYHAITGGPDIPYNDRLGLNTYFYVTKDLPNNTDITCRVTVLAPDEQLHNLYGPVQLTIERAVEW